MIARPFHRRWYCVLTASIALLLLAGCARQPAHEPDGVMRTSERGPLRVTLEVSPQRPTVGDAVRISLTVEAPTDYDIRFPDPSAFNELKVTALAAPETQPAAQGRVLRRRWQVIPLLSGKLEVPELPIHYTRPATATDTQPVEGDVLIEPVTLEVRSVLTTQDSPAQPRDITGTLVPPKPPLSRREWALRIALVVVVLAGVLAAAFLYVRWKRRPVPPIAPDVWALRQLAGLEQIDWADSDAVREFYYRLTEIVRAYIERRFGLAAPEMTTEEFLAALARDRGAVPYDPGRLREFLESCDIVKYAAVQPTRSDGESALATARAFIDASAAAAPVVTGEGLIEIEGTAR